MQYILLVPHDKYVIKYILGKISVTKVKSPHHTLDTYTKLFTGLYRKHDKLYLRVSDIGILSGFGYNEYYKETKSEYTVVDFMKYDFKEVI